MPVPPDYDKTLEIYLKLREKADSNHETRYSLRQLARDLEYKSWSAVRWHVLHLENVGLITKDMTRTHTDRPIKIVYPDWCDIGELTQFISQGERTSWQKRAAEAKGEVNAAT